MGAQHGQGNEFRPTASWDGLRVRAELLKRVRHFFDSHDFLEVETPLLSHDTVIDRHIEPISVDVSGHRMWLQTSPEFAMKRLLASGVDAIYQVTRSFRADEIGQLHNPEFTIVEWYRVGDDMSQGMELLDEVQRELLQRGQARHVTYRQAFLDHVAIDPHVANMNELRQAADNHNVSVPDSYVAGPRDDWLDLLLVECVERHLGRDRPVILYDYPASQAALARTRAEDPPVAERFELYVDGIELANGYHELVDADVLRERNDATNEARRRDGKPVLPEGSRLLDAMDAGLPPCCGVALGFDRLVMVATGVKDIREVMAFPFDRV